MPVTIRPQELSDEPSLPGSEDSFEATQAAADDGNAAPKDGQSAAGAEPAEKSQRDPSRSGLLQGDTANQGVVKPPLGN